MSDHDDVPVVRLTPWSGEIAPDDPDANFKAEVAAYSRQDALSTVESLARSLDLPVGAVVRYVLARWASGGSEGLLELGTSAVERMSEVVDRAEAAGTDLARLEAYAVLRQQLSWLRAGVDDPVATYPSGGAGPRRVLRVGVYGVISDGGRILLCRVSAGNRGAGRWTLPGGGLDHGEPVEDGLRREIREETGLDATLGRVLDVDARRIGPDRTRTGVDLHWVRIYVAATVDTVVEPTAEEGGSTDRARWVRADELADLGLVDVARRGVALAGLGEATG